ncbi:MAG: hypothetical protein WB511_05730 [Nitrososphaeraceae archaeon]
MKMKVLIERSKESYRKTTSLLIALHTGRILGVTLLWGVFEGIFPPAFGLPAGVGDILIGVTAIPFALFLWKGYRWVKYALIVWNVLGIADLVNAISLGLITSSGFGTSTITTFPWILIPTVAVPIYLGLHAIILYRLRDNRDA